MWSHCLGVRGNCQNCLIRDRQRSVVYFISVSTTICSLFADLNSSDQTIEVRTLHDLGGGDGDMRLKDAWYEPSCGHGSAESGRAGFNESARAAAERCAGLRRTTSAAAAACT